MASFSFSSLTGILAIMDIIDYSPLLKFSFYTIVSYVVSHLVSKEKTLLKKIQGYLGQSI
jgi:hypothetical protein